MFCRLLKISPRSSLYSLGIINQFVLIFRIMVWWLLEGMANHEENQFVSWYL